MNFKILAAAVCLMLAAGCASTRDSVIATTATVLGVEVAQNPATQLYHAKLGYSRAEIAFVPTNRGQTNSATGGATEVGNVIMELRMHNLFSGGGVYQRLAVGSVAVTQPGASFMFAKDASGTLDTKTAEVVGQSLKSIPSPDAQATAIKSPLATAYQSAPDKSLYDTVAKSKGYASFKDFLSRTDTTLAEVSAIRDALKAAGIPIP